MKIINPANEKHFADLEEDTKDSIELKHKNALLSFDKYKKTNLKERISWIANYKLKILENIDHLALTLTEDMGKPLSQSIGEIKGAIGRLDFFINQSERFLKTEVVNESQTHIESIAYEPLGIVVNISAWNFPYNIGFNVFVPALIAGNAVLYKPSEYAARTGEKMVSLLYESGVPNHLIQVVHGGGIIGSSLLDLNIDGVYFTGSHATGIKIYEQVAPKMIPCQLELGGKDPFYVNADNTNLPSVVDSALEGVFWNNGQSCCAVERIYVHEKLYDSFLDLFIEKAKAIIMGDPLDEDTFIGPLARKEQIKIIQAQVDDAIEKGAKLLLGGKEPDMSGYYYMPTVISDTNHSMLLMKEESFGPIIGIQKVSSDEEAISLMKDTEYGLSSAVFSDTYESAKPILDSMDSGTVYWNCCDRVSPHTPWSGRKKSGIGSTLSYIGIRAFSQPKSYQLRKA